MGQKDPATEWQREGYEMFGMMMTSIALDFVKYVMHVQVAVQRPEEDEQKLEGVSADKSDASPGTPTKSATATPTAAPALPEVPATRAPVVRSDLEKVGRNQPCPCGSGRKYKLCHGRPGGAG
jgi:preprotein translocase subunit SecA